MRRKAIFGALLLIAVGVLLGGTVFRDQVASARSLAQSVFVSNTSANPVPVSAASTLPVHEQGTATVGLSGSANTVKLDSGGNTVKPQVSNDFVGADLFVPIGQQTNGLVRFDAGAPDLSLIEISMSSNVRLVVFFANDGTTPVFDVSGPAGDVGQAHWVFPFASPIQASYVKTVCADTTGCDGEFFGAATSG